MVGDIGNETKDEKDSSKFLDWEDRGTRKDGEAEGGRGRSRLMCRVQEELERSTGLVRVGVSSEDSETGLYIV